MPTKELQNDRIVDADEVIGNIIDNGDTSVKFTYALSKTSNRISTEADDLEDFRMQILRRHAETDENGQLEYTQENGTVKAKFEDEDARSEFEKDLREIYGDTSEVEFHEVDVKHAGDYVLGTDEARTIRFMISGLPEETVQLSGSEIEASVNTLQSMLVEDAANDDYSPAQLPFGLTVAAIDNAEALMEIQRSMEEKRQELLKQHAETDEDGNLVTVEDTDRAKFPGDEAQEEYQEAMREVYLEDYSFQAKKVNIDFLNEGDVEPGQMVVVDWMFDE